MNNNEQISCNDGKTLLTISSKDLQKSVMLIYSVMSHVNGKLTCLKGLLPLSADIQSLTQELNECCVSLQIGVDTLEELFTKFSRQEDSLRHGATEESNEQCNQSKLNESYQKASEQGNSQTKTSCTSQPDTTILTADLDTKSETITSDTNVPDKLLHMSYGYAVDIFLNRGYVNGYFDPYAWRQCILIISERLRQVDTLIDYAERIYEHCTKTSCNSCQFNEHQDENKTPVCLLYYPEMYWDIKKLKQIKERKEEQESE